MTEDLVPVSTEPQEHLRSWDCWCEPRLFEACPECIPFGAIPADDQGPATAALWQAIAVQIPIHGLTAKRPKRAKGCWRCGGEGVRELTLAECPLRGKDAPQVAVLHRPPPQTQTPGQLP